MNIAEVEISCHIMSLIDFYLHSTSTYYCPCSCPFPITALHEGGTLDHPYKKTTLPVTAQMDEEFDKAFSPIFLSLGTLVYPGGLKKSYKITM